MPGNWDAYPQNDVVCWPRDEKIIGVLGVAPLATADFFYRLCSRPVHKDWEHPRVIIDSNPKIPSRGRYLELGEADPVPFIKTSIAALAEQGAQIIAVPCNTAHIFYDRYAMDAPAVLPNIIEVTASSCAKYGYRRALVLASQQVIKHNLYHQALSFYNIEAIVPDQQGQKLVSYCIESIKQNKYNAEIAEKIVSMARISRVNIVILGCTELSVLFKNYGLNSIEFIIIDSNQELAKYCIEFATGVSLQKFCS